MRKFIPVLLVVFALAACETKKQSDEQAIRAMCGGIIEYYPEATLQDVYKTCFQDFFGAEHLMRDTAIAHRYLSEELKACALQDLNAMPPCEPTGFRHRFMRLNLSQVLTGRMSEEELFDRFVAAAGSDNAAGDDWAGEWKLIESVALDVHPEWTDSALQAELRYAASVSSAVWHSEQFRKAYNPHYRIIRNLPDSLIAPYVQ